MSTVQPLLAPIAGTLAATLVLVWVYAHLYRADRQRYLVLFAAAWFVDGLRHASGALVVLGAPPLLGEVRLVAVPVFAGLLLAGARRFRSLGLAPGWIVFLVLGSVASLVARVAGASFAGFTAPAFVVAGLAVATAGVELIRGSDPRGRYVAGAASVVLGLHMLDYPLLRPMHDFAMAGYVLSGTLETVVAVGVLLVHLSRTQRALLEKSRLLQGVIDEAGSLVAVKDLQGRYILVNRPFADQLQLPSARLLGRRVGDVVSPAAAAIIDERESAGRAEGAPRGDVETRAGRTYDVNRFPMLDEQGKPFATGVAYTDITDQLLTQERLQGAAKFEALATLARGVVHDLNNLLTVISGHVGELAQRLPDDGEVAEIRGALQRGETLARGLLAFTSRQRLSPRVVDLDEVVQSARGVVEQSAGESIVVDIRSAPGPCRAQVDAEQIALALGHLAQNAREATPGSGRVEIETALVEVEGERARSADVQPGMFVMISFRDSGAGMSAETRAHMFDPFFTTKSAEPGAGLGLASVYGVVKQSRGFIEVDSELGRGTEIRILLPHADEHSRLSSRKLRSATPVDPAASANILLVEDDPAVRRVVARALVAHGYAVLQAADGEQGLERAQALAGRFALVITDVEMPRMGGVEMVERITAARPGTPVLFMSGYTDAVDRIARAHAERDFIQKPFEPQALLERVSALLGSSAPESEIRARETASPGSGGVRRSSS